MERRTFILLGIAGTCIGVPAHAAEIRFPDVAWGAEEKSLLDMKPVLAGELAPLPGPPGTDSPESRQELREIAQAQALGVPDHRVTRGREELHKPTGDVLRSRGVIPDTRVAPTVWSLLATMDRDISIAVAHEALRHGRLPPHVVSDEIDDLGKTPPVPAFPSLPYARFHTALGLISVLNANCEKDREAVLADIGRNLTEIGAHRKSDLTSAGLLSSLYLSKALITSPVEDALATARIEMGIHHRLEGCRLP